jgi:hypothetical protein
MQAGANFLNHEKLSNLRSGLACPVHSNIRNRMRGGFRLGRKLWGSSDSARRENIRLSG